MAGTTHFDIQPTGNRFIAYSYKIDEDGNRIVQDSRERRTRSEAEDALEAIRLEFWS